MKLLLTLAVAIGATVAYGHGGAAFYPPGTGVQDIHGSMFDKIVKQSNYTSIVEFYAPWCGYCQKLAPTYRKLAKSLTNYAVNVVSVNCDDNRQLCAKYQIEGYPTLMVFRPPKYDKQLKSAMNEPALETYQQKRDAKSIHNYVVGRIKNYVKRLPAPDTKEFAHWISLDDKGDKLVLISKAKIPSPMLKTLAIDFLSSALFGHNPSKTDTVTINGENYELPLFIHYKNDSIKIYDGALSDRIAITKWISTVTGKLPTEGPLSRKKNKKNKKSKKVHDEL